MAGLDDLVGRSLGISTSADGLGLPAPPDRRPAAREAAPSQDPAAEREALQAALDATEWNLSRAASRLGVARNTLRYRIERLGLLRAARGVKRTPPMTVHGVCARQNLYVLTTRTEERPMMGRRCRHLRFPLLLVAAAILAGCGTVRLYDESKAKFATGIKDKYTKAEVLGAIEVEKRNLDNLLAEEVKVVREHQQLAVDSALLRIAADGTPMARIYTDRAQPRIKTLGFDSFAKLRDYRLAGVEAFQIRRDLHSKRITITKLATAAPPECHPGVALPMTLAEAVLVPESLPTDEREAAEETYGQYRSRCDDLKPFADPAGQLQNTRDEWKAAEKAATALDRALANAQQDVKTKTEAYDKAVAAEKAATGAAQSVKERLQKQAADALKALNAAKEALAQAPNQDAATLSNRLNALVTVLSAAAGGTIDTSDENLKKAATIAQEIPSLAGDMAALLNQSKVPPVNGLLIEMRHQLLLLEQTKQLRGYAQQRVDILQGQYDALQEEARLWLRFGDAMCSYGLMHSLDKDKAVYPGQRCDSFTVDQKGVCKEGMGPGTPCLDQPWNKSIQGSSDHPATRELYKALAAYLQALAIQATENEQTFRLIDISHREALVTREAALKQWDNLIAVPVSQLDAYYQAGLKPAEIADLVVKALGFAAITVGVSK